MPEIAILDDYQNVALQLADWSALPNDWSVQVFTDHLDDQDALAARLQPFAIVCAMRERTPFPRALLERLPNLKLLLTGGMLNASIDVQAANALGVTVCGTNSAAHATVEMTWGLILALLRHIPREDHATRAGWWQVAVGHDLRGKTLGVIGLGRLGSQVARIGLAFGMRVIAWSANLTDARAAEVGVARTGKNELLAQSDVITVHQRLSERTRGLIGAAEFALMKPSAYLINTSRGPIVEETALIDALRGRRIAGAALDVFDQEPLPQDHPLRRIDNTVITPHTAFVTEETLRLFYREMLEDIQAYLAGAPIRVIGA